VALRESLQRLAPQLVPASLRPVPASELALRLVPVPAPRVPECLRPALWPALGLVFVPRAPLHSGLLREAWLSAPMPPLTPSAEGRKL